MVIGITRAFSTVTAPILRVCWIVDSPGRDCMGQDCASPGGTRRHGTSGQFDAGIFIGIDPTKKERKRYERSARIQASRSLIMDIGNIEHSGGRRRRGPREPNTVYVLLENGNIKRVIRPAGIKVVVVTHNPKLAKYVVAQPSPFDGRDCYLIEPWAEETGS